MLIDTPQFIQPVPWLLNSLDWFQAFRILWEYVSRIGVYTLDSAGKFFCIFFGNNCLLICPLLAFQARRALECEAPCFISCFTLKRGATSPAPPQTLVLSFNAPSPHGWLVLRHWACVPIHPSIAWRSGDGSGTETQRILLSGEKCQAGWWRIRKEEYCPLRLESWILLWTEKEMSWNSFFMEKFM